MSTIEKALEIALKAHWHQKDKAGNSYILHPLRVMQKGKTTNEQIVGILHDVVEDSAITYADLEAAGFSTEIIAAVNALTKRPNESYEQFIQRVLHNPLAIKVKMNDISDNLDVTRLNQLTEKDTQRINKYLESLRILQKKDSDVA
jgi:(p)ppGpp synthase/HD superfamily hydrolase